MKHFCIYTNLHKDKDLLMTKRIQTLLTQKGMECSVKLHPEDPMQPGTDCILVLGGDGTVLNAARERIGKQNIPILGINMGTLGYLTEVEPEGVESALEKLLSGDFELESRMMLDGSLIRGGQEIHTDWALNDIVIRRDGAQQLLQFHLYVNKKFLNKYQADGMIVTTPTGSTGYNLSAGGPIVEPMASLLVLTPICPHTLNQRSVVLSAEDVVEIEIPAGREGQEQHGVVNFDGQAVEIATGDLIRIRKSAQTTEFIKIGNAGFLETLHKKMSENG